MKLAGRTSADGPAGHGTRSLTIGAKIAGQSVTFAGSVSVPIGAPGWGIEISGTLGYSGGPDVSLIERWGPGCATAIADLVKSLIELRKAKTGGVLNGAAAVTQIVNAGLANAITDGLAKAWTVEGSKASMDLGASGIPDAVSGLGTSSTLQVARILGHDGEAVIARLEVRSGRKLEVNTTLSGAGVKVSVRKSLWCSRWATTRVAGMPRLSACGPAAARTRSTRAADVEGTEPDVPLGEVRYRLDAASTIEMVTLTGDCLSVAVQTVDIDGARVDVTGFVSTDTWRHVVRLGAFHVDLEPGEVPEDGGADVEIVLTLRRPWIDRFDNGDASSTRLFTADDAEHEQLLQTDAWLLASAMRRLAMSDQDGATITAGGYRTRWAPPLY